MRRRRNQTAFGPEMVLRYGKSFLMCVVGGDTSDDLRVSSHAWEDLGSD